MSQSNRKVPELSLLSYVQGSATDKIRFIDDLFMGIKDYGFIILTDHTVESNLTNAGYEVVHEFFSLPLETKKKYICQKGAGQRGYTPFGVEHAKNSEAPDLKEFWHVGRELPSDHRFKALYPDNIWVDEIPMFKPVLSKLYSALDASAGPILHALGKALDVPENYFQEMITNGNSILRPIHYPPLKQGAMKGSVRSAAHEDINLITILMGATASGLQLLDRDGTWLDVETKPGQLVVDSGDMLSRLTNEVIPATTHRVVNPSDENSTRYSMPFFVHPHPETVLSCIPSCKGPGEKYPPINSHEFLMQRLREIGLMKV